MFNKILIANRGEIAVRIIRACKEMGIRTIAVFSEVDKKSLHVQLADESYCIGKSKSEETYLNYTEIIYTALKSGAEAIHPGYGFLSENTEFAEMCKTLKVTFIGPSPDSIKKMGDKSVARNTIKKAGIDILRGSKDIVKNEADAQRVADKIGYPLLIKPTAGGGGKGMRIVHDRNNFISDFHTSQAEAKAAFGNGDIYLERYVESARHIEVQILADRYGHILHLGERECSIQRRHQKLIEESPSPIIDKKMRDTIGKLAVTAAKSINYVGAGTVEFLMDNQGTFYFIEMNTRIQVEHPVTELITNLDLVKAQILIAAGKKLKMRQRRVTFSGHAIECRINAEDPKRGFIPSPGRIKKLLLPGGPGVRIDTHIYNGYVIPHYYDSLLAKLIVWGENRQTAIARMKRALEEVVIKGVKTTIPFHLKILNHPDFNSGNYTVNFIQKNLENRK